MLIFGVSFPIASLLIDVDLRDFVFFFFALLLLLLATLTNIARLASLLCSDILGLDNLGGVLGVCGGRPLVVLVLRRQFHLPWTESSILLWLLPAFVSRVILVLVRRERFQVDRAWLALVGVVQLALATLGRLLLLGGRHWRQGMLRVLGCRRGRIAGRGRVGRRLFALLLCAVHFTVRVVQDPRCLWEVDQIDVFLNEFRNERAHIVDLRERLKKGNHLEETAIVRVVIPRQDRHGVLVVEEVRVRRVVHYDNVFHIAAKQRQVLDVRALETEAVLSVEAHRDELVLVERVDQGVRVDAH